MDIAKTACWFFEEDATDYRDYREDFPCVVSPWWAAWFEFPASAWSNQNGLPRRATLRCHFAATWPAARMEKVTADRIALPSPGEARPCRWSRSFNQRRAGTAR
jgi:hypothetical protein